jgi:modification target Cys-rich repeat protein
MGNSFQLSDYEIQKLENLLDNSTIVEQPSMIDEKYTFGCSGCDGSCSGDCAGGCSDSCSGGCGGSCMGSLLF